MAKPSYYLNKQRHSEWNSCNETHTSSRHKSLSYTLKKKRADVCTHRYTHTHTQTQRHSKAHTNTHMHTLRQSKTRTRTHTHTQTHINYMCNCIHIGAIFHALCRPPGIGADDLVATPWLWCGCLHRLTSFITLMFSYCSRPAGHTVPVLHHTF